jgi:hypothetical protein
MGAARRWPDRTVRQDGRFSGDYALRLAIRLGYEVRSGQTPAGSQFLPKAFWLFKHILSANAKLNRAE